jgi:hypothetical protein
MLLGTWSGSLVVSVTTLSNTSKSIWIAERRAAAFIPLPGPTLGIVSGPVPEMTWPPAWQQPPQEPPEM